MALPPEKLSSQPAAQVGSELDYAMVVQDGESRRQTRPQLRTALLSIWQGFIRTFLSAATPQAARAAIEAISSADNITGSAAKLTTARAITLTGPVTGSVNFDGSGNAAIDTALSANFTLPAGAAATTQAVGDSDTSPATTAFVQAAIANKRTWTAYTPAITPLSGTYTSAAATGAYMDAFGIRHIRIQLTVTTKGTGANPSVSLPAGNVLAGHANDLLQAREVAVTGKMGVARAALTGLSLSAYDATDLITADGCVVVITGSYPLA